ncbi:MAG: hypothetical protein ACM3PY_16405, partial [Omnitrophica WOR_2 bacterium]
DFYVPEGHVNEDIFAYSNKSGEERSLVVYHNKYASTRGWIRNSVGYSIKTGPTGDRAIVQKNLGEGLGLDNDSNAYCIFRDHLSGLEFIRNNRELYEKGLYVELEAYKCAVFLNFQQVYDNEWHQYAQLAAYLNGRGVPNIQDVMKEIFLQPIHYPFRELVNAGFYEWVIDHRLTLDSVSPDEIQPVLDEAEIKAGNLLREVKRLIQGSGDEAAIARELRDKLAIVLEMPVLERRLPGLASIHGKEILDYLKPAGKADPLIWGTVLSWLFTHELGKTVAAAEPGETGYAEISRTWIDEWLLGKIIAGALQDTGIEEGAAWRAISLVKLLVIYQDWFRLDDSEPDQVYKVLQGWLGDSEIQSFIGVNRYQGILWYNKESFESLIWWMFYLAVIGIACKTDGNEEQAVEQINRCYEMVYLIHQAEDESGYQIEKLLEETKVLS